MATTTTKRRNPYEKNRVASFKRRKTTGTTYFPMARFYPRPLIKAPMYQPSGYPYGRPIRRESKFVDNPAGSVAFAAAPTAAAVAVVSPGSAFYQRVGNKLIMKSLRVKGFLQSAVNGQSSQQMLRVLIVLDRFPAGAALSALTAVVSDTSVSGVQTTSIQSQLNINNRARFKILRDLMFYVPSLTNTGGGVAGVITNVGPQDQEQCMRFDEYIRFGNLEQQYLGNTQPSTSADVNTNLVLIYAQCQSGLDGQWNVVLESRFKFDDPQ